MTVSKSAGGQGPIVGLGVGMARRGLFGERLVFGSPYGFHSVTQPPVVPLLGVVPFHTGDRQLTVDALVWFLGVNGAAGSLFRGGIWTTVDMDTLAPGNLIAETGSQPADSGAGPKVVLLAQPLTLQAGALYWLGGVCENGGANLRVQCVAAQATALPAPAYGSGIALLLGLDPTGLTTLLTPGTRSGFTRAGFTPTTGLPDPFGATAYFKGQPTVDLGSRIPALYVRAA